jgi:hypothetical protein
MTDSTYPTFSNKCEILADLWYNYRGDEQFEDFIEYNDIGLPLAYLITEEICKPTEIATKYIDETYALLVEALGVSDKETYESIDQMLGEANG